jgi:glycosyltransferase involved in cell wall biosynthesis
MSKPNIVMIGPFPADETKIEGGVQASLYGLCRRLLGHPDLAGLRVIAVTKRIGGPRIEGTVAGIPVVYLTAPWRFMMSMILNLPSVLRLIAEIDDPVVHLHGSGLFEALLLVACHRARIPVVWTMHGITEKETREAWRRNPRLSGYLRHLLYGFVERQQVRMARRIIVDTDYVAREIAGRVRSTPVVIPQGIFLGELAAARNTDRRGHTVLALGVIDPRKGHRLTIRAFAEVLKKVPDARLKIVGALGSVAHLAELHEEVHSLDLSHHVEILIDQPRSVLLDELREARVFALHSQEESQGIALCEAMGCGLPIVATRVGGIPDVIGDSGAGTLVDYGDIAGFAAAIVELLTDDAAAAKASAAALVRGADFDWDAITARVVGLYEAARDDARPIDAG